MWIKLIRGALATVGIVQAMALAVCAAEPPAIWGVNGDKWQKDRPLRDFSYAGYRQSERPIPAVNPSVNIKDFGGSGDGQKDDTQALLKAIAACPAGGKVLLPAGDYVITDLIEIGKPVVLAGAGADRTRLMFPKYLVDLHPRMGATTTGIPTSLWSWSGGFIEFHDTKEAGIEDLTFQFPEVPYPGHFKEHGSNGINFENVHDGWARRLKFVNCDCGIFVANSRNVTLRDIEFDAWAGRSAIAGVAGHHAIDFVLGSTRCLGDRIHFNGIRLFHELGIEHEAHGNVYTRCSGPDMALDHHQPDIHGNLWTDIDVGKGKMIWVNNCRGSTMDEVYWNIRSQSPIVFPKPELKNIVIGVTGSGAEMRNAGGPWVEIIEPARLDPKNLFRAQLERRIGVQRAATAFPE